MSSQLKPFGRLDVRAVQWITTHRPLGRRLVVSAAVTLAGFAAVKMIGNWKGQENELYPLMLASSMFIALYADARVGVLFALLNALLFDYFFVEPFGILLHRVHDVLRLVLFVGSSVLICGLVSLLGRAFRKAEAEEKLKEDILRVVAHDLRNPLAAILLSCELQRRHKVTASREFATSYETISRAAKQMNRLVKDLLESAKFREGRFPIEVQSVEPVKLLDDVRDVFSPELARQGLAFGIVVEKSTPAVSCDRERIFQVLSNLVGNALKVTPAGGRIELRAQSRDGMVEFTVADTGHGIRPELLPHLFEQYSPARSQAGLGLGLGLYIAKCIVLSHGGQIHACSEEGAGTRITFTLKTDERSGCAA